MIRITRDKITYEFSPEMAPVAVVQPGEVVELQTHDCFTGQLQSEEDLITAVDFSRVNPATGPVAVEGAKPGDLLVVEIQEIKLGDKGFMVTIPGEGAFGSRFSTPATKIVQVKEGKFHFNRSLSFPVRPMIGVIGVAPKHGPVPCGENGDHGGNMDATVITAGSRLYFLVRQSGGLLGLGDVHAGMGDGESVICGVEIPAVVRIKLGLVPSPEYSPLRPVVDLEDRFITIGHGPTLDDAAQQALDDMLELVMYKTGMQVPEAAMLISAVGDLKVCQIVDPQKTARVEMPRSVLPDPLAPLWKPQV
jgi:amidase